MDNSTRRKDEIIEAAINLIVENGIDATSMQQIANEVGISKASLYFYFESKVALVQQVYQWCFSMDVEACREGMEEEKDSIGKLCRRFMNIIDFSISHPKESMVEMMYYLSPLYCERPANLKREYSKILKLLSTKELPKGKSGRQTPDFWRRLITEWHPRFTWE